MNLNEAKKKIEEVFSEFAFNLLKLNYKNISNKEAFFQNLKNMTNLYLGKIIAISRQLPISKLEQEEFVLTELKNKISLVVPSDFPYLFTIFVSQTPGCRFGWLEKKGKLAAITSDKLVVMWVKDINNIEIQEIDFWPSK